MLLPVPIGLPKNTRTQRIGLQAQSLSLNLLTITDGYFNSLLDEPDLNRVSAPRALLWTTVAEEST